MKHTFYTPDQANNSTRFCNQKHIRRQTHSLSNERLTFLDGESLGDVDIYSETGDTRRKVRRIVEKRICQDLYRRNKAASYNDNYGRYNEKHRVSNSLKNIYGGFPSSTYAA